MEKKVYAKKSEKVIDFIIGFFLIPIFFGIPISLIPLPRFYRGHSILSWFIFLLELIFIIYLSIKRRFIKIGLIYSLVVAPLVFFGTCFLIILGISRSH